MFRFEHLHYFWALSLIPLLTIFFISMRLLRKRSLLQFGDEKLTSRLMPQVSNLKHPLKFSFLMVALALLIVAWANPQWGYRKENVRKLSSDVFIAFDISNSMFCRDIVPSRLERSRVFALDLVKTLRAERIGTIIFAGRAYLQMPLTTDYAAAQMMLKAASPQQMTAQGTAIGEAIQIAEETSERMSKAQRVLILISDGEDNDENALAAAKKARENGFTIFTIGAGTAKGDIIPMDLGGGQFETKRDPETHQPVITKLNENYLKELAKVGGGNYFNLAQNTNIEAAIAQEMTKIEKRGNEIRLFSEFESYYQIPLMLAMLILLFEFLLPYRRSTWLEDKDWLK